MTIATTGSQASSGSGARPGRRSSQAAPSRAMTTSGTFRPNAGPSRTTSARTPMQQAGGQDAAGEGTIHG